MRKINFGRAEERCEQIALYMLENNATVRKAASMFGISKSTVHKDVTGTLKKYNYRLYLEVKELLDVNKSERHVRGGEATRKKYSEIKMKTKQALP
ncbi:MAG: sporulation transcriptional regulator SpoIIID [Clostridia bacterium]|nr:sporulation transcriptional regulator SpoIIID [Clostridia bacterium]